MDFRLTEQEELFRREVNEFIRRELPADWSKRLIAPLLDGYDDSIWEITKTMARKFGEKGWLTLTWPREYGGREASPILNLLFQEELLTYGAPGRDPIGIGMVGPTIIQFGSEEHKKKYLLPMAKGEMFCAECLSEPDSGSDMASIKTLAKEETDCFVVNGQKVWTTGGHRAEVCILLARTDPDVPKHKGLSCFLVDLNTPGITINPIENLIGTRDFNEIYFDDVRFPKENLIGKKNHGWEICMALFDYERAAIIENDAVAKHILDELIEYIKETESNGKPALSSQLRSRIAELAVEVEIGRLIAYWAAWEETKGIPSTLVASESKLFGSELKQRAASLGIQVLGLFGQLAEGSNWAPMLGSFERQYLATRADTIAAGTSEVLRGLIATRGLGLPVR